MENYDAVYYVIENSQNGRTWSRLPHQFGSYSEAIESGLVEVIKRIGKQWCVVKITEEIVEEEHEA